MVAERETLGQKSRHGLWFESTMRCSVDAVTVKTWSCKVKILTHAPRNKDFAVGNRAIPAAPGPCSSDWKEQTPPKR